MIIKDLGQDQQKWAYLFFILSFARLNIDKHTFRLHNEGNIRYNNGWWGWYQILAI